MASNRRQAKQPDLVALGRRIAEVRAERGMTQEAVTERSGLAANVISQIENGHRDVRFTTLWRLAAALDLPLSQLLRDQ